MDSTDRPDDSWYFLTIVAMFAPSPPPNRCQKMTSAVLGCPPVKPVAIGEAHPDIATASATPPPAARNWRRDSPVINYL